MELHVRLTGLKGTGQPRGSSSSWGHSLAPGRWRHAQAPFHLLTGSGIYWGAKKSIWRICLTWFLRHSHVLWKTAIAFTKRCGFLVVRKNIKLLNLQRGNLVGEFAADWVHFLTKRECWGWQWTQLYRRDVIKHNVRDYISSDCSL